MCEFENETETIRQKSNSSHPQDACDFIKKEALAQVFSCELCEIFKNTFSYRTLPVAASVEGNFLN